MSASARHIVSLCALLLLTLSAAGCGVKAVTYEDPALMLANPGFTAPVSRELDVNATHDIEFMEVDDPWEPMNRSLYRFNAGFDEYVFLPGVAAYEAVLPDPVEEGIHNFIQNANELPTLLNCLLQGKMKKGAITLSRFLVNSTVGIGGLMDLASKNENYPLQKEDVGQTLGVWGVGNGPYFVCPIMGPSNLRDTVGMGGDFLLLLYQMRYFYDLAGIENTTAVAITELLLRALDLRAHEPFRYYGTGSPFEYEMVRFIYTKKRELEISR